MPYGVKQGFKAPGEFGLGDMLGLGLASASGIIAALVTDFQQQGEASALFTINRWVVNLGSILGFTDIPLWMVIIGLTVIGAGSVFYFQPITRQGAFAQGFGLLAVIVTAAPSNLAGGIESINDVLPGLQPGVETREASLRGGVFNASFTPGSANVYEAQTRSEATKYDVHLLITFPNGIPDNIDNMIRRGTIRGRLHNEDTAETWNIFRSAGGTIQRQGNSLVVHAGVPARSPSSRLWVRIECVGYAIEEQSAIASLNQRLEWAVEMKSSSMPLFMQRLGKSYWF